MTYLEFRSTYKWMLKQYPETSFAYNFPKEIREVKKQYRKSGSRWVLESETAEMIDGTFYANCVDAVPFFRWIGGHERVTMAYTRQGYIPVEISSISPDKTQKTVREYHFS